ncbi:hypothetical protein BKA67DRAFT_536501 [Truncatella angustata]|uniref:Uncharacterized protein n=1 Tax=Truncatella angustata TaxID=152316 RepID=A0A9P8UIG2_9PEZI|nr:uncharacterized protein BKA67DRAFT_536501 [Truncatella angustata]KAH6652781.1 hypothetical protein BKA67DRAFT_536501 [Truncatella angustata]KAH8204690.1 hypothetical protein TruAng_001165 [Truncatella angustata]
MDGIRASSPTKNAAGNESPEQLLDVFRAAALSVTKLYKTSAAAQTKARNEGYQDCLEDLLVFLDKHNIGVGDGEGWQIRRWATERFDRDGVSQSIESEDEAEKNEPASSPELHRDTSHTPLPIAQHEPDMRRDSAPPAPAPTLTLMPAPAANHPAQVTSSPAPIREVTVPSQDNFTFQSSVAYPQDADLSMANLDLSDSRSNNPSHHHASSRMSRSRNNKNGLQRPRNLPHVNRSAAGQKRKLNMAEIFDLGSIGGKDLFGGNGGGKRSRHA